MTIDGLMLAASAPLQRGSFYGKYVTEPKKTLATDCDSSLISKEPTWDHQAMPKTPNGKKCMTLRSSYHQTISSFRARREDSEDTHITDSEIHRGEMASAAVETNCDNPLGWTKMNRDQTIMEKCDSRKYMTLRSTPQSHSSVMNCSTEEDTFQHSDLVQDKVNLDDKKDKSLKVRSLQKNHKMKQKDPLEVKDSEKVSFGEVSDTNKRKTEEDSPESLIVSIKKKKLAKSDLEISAQEKECPICNEKFLDSHSFTIHIREHNTNTHTCQICSKKLSSASSLDRHMYVHSGERPFKCTICNIAFTTNGNMHRHMRIHRIKDELRAKGEAKILKKSEAQKKKMSSILHPTDQNSHSTNLDTESAISVDNVHMEVAEDTPNEPDVNCPVCGKAFFTEENLQEHMETHPNDPIKCHNCDVVSEDYVSHQKHDCGSSSKDNPIPQPDQDKSVVGFHDLTDFTFVEFSSPKFSLIAKTLCENQSRRPSSAFLAFECHTCGKAFPCGRALRQHETIHNDKSGTFCHSCKCDFPSPEDLQAHKLKHRAAEHCKSSNCTDNPAGAPSERKEDFFAVLELSDKKINTRFDNKEEVFENMDYFVFGKSPATTLTIKNECLGEASNDLADIPAIISLASKTPLMPDMRASPVTASPASPVKGISTPAPNSPLIEESAHASSETPSKEESTNNTSKDEDSNNENADDSTNLPGEGFQCKECDACFPSSNALRRHSRVHNQSSTTYSCDVCSYQSADKSTLMRHLRTHNGERPFLCKVCNYAFTTKANAQRHVKKKHEVPQGEINNVIQYNPDMSELKNPENLPADVGSAETVCKYCNKDFMYNRVLRHHLRSLNNSCSCKPYACGACKLGFSTKNNCIRHICNQHPELKDKVKELVVPNTASDISDQECHQNCNDCHSGNSGTNAHIEPLNLTLSETDGSLCLDLSSDAYLSSDAEKVSVAQSLVSLSEALPPQEKPLDLTMSALDLTVKPEPCCILPENQSESAIVPRTSFEGCVQSSNTQLAYLSPLLRSPIPVRSPVKPSIFISNSSSPLNAVNVPEPINLMKGTFLPINLVRDVPIEKQSTPSSAILQPPQICFSEAESPIKCSNVSADMKEEHGTQDRPQTLHSNVSVQNGSDENCTVTFKLVKNKLTHNNRPFTCNHCSAEFTLKSNKERHIKRKHPEFARPTRSRNFIPTLSPTNLQKQSASTLSNKTRDALRTVLSSKVHSLMQKSENPSSKSFEPAPSFSQFKHSPEKFLANTIHKSNATQHFSEGVALAAKDRNDSDNADLASVSAVIDTANSPVFKKYLTDAKKESDDEKSDDRTLEQVNFSEPSMAENVVPLSSDDDVSGKKSSYTKSLKSVACCFCNRRFPWRSSLRRHILTHTGQKPYKCPKCPINFTTKSNRDRHLFRKHRGVDALSRNVPDRKYKCRFCPNSSFSTQAKLRKHNYIRHKMKTSSGKLLKSYDVRMAENIPKIDPGASTSVESNHVGKDEKTHTIISSDVKQDKVYNKEVVLFSKVSQPLLKTHKELPVQCGMNSEVGKKGKDAPFRASANVLLNCVQKDISQKVLAKCNNQKVNVVMCCFCFKVIESHESLSTHVKEHATEFPCTCKLCGQVFMKTEALLCHQRWHLEKQAAGQNGVAESILFSSKSAAQQKQKCQNSVVYLFTTQHPAPSKLSSDSVGSVHNDVKSSRFLSNGKPLVKKDQSDSNDLIQDLLGVKDPKYIEDMLDCAAAKLLQSGKT